MDRQEMRKRADRRFELMLADRLEHEAWWRELALQYAPDRGRYTKEERPRKGRLWRNSRARQVPDDFAAGIKSGLTSPSRPWFTLTLYDNRLAEEERIKTWLTKVQDVMQGQMIRTNLYDQLFDVYKEQGIFGTAALLIEEDEEDMFRATCMTIGTWCIGVDRRGKVDRFGRQFSRTLTQLAEEFGEEALPAEMRSRLREEPENERYELRWLIEPSEDWRRGEGPEGEFRWRSLWWLKGYSEPEFLRVGGYREMPVMAPRWRVIGDDIYGREQPGDVGLDDARTIQELELDERSAIKKGVRPPVTVAQDMVEGALQDWPGGVTVFTPMQDRPVVMPLYQVQFDHQSVAAKRMELQARLEEIFYVNFFRMWTADQRQGRTATEIEAREAEKMYMLGPLIERQMSEMLDPLIERIFAIMERRGAFPPPPEELEGADMKIEYTSILASVQKQAAQAGLDIVLMNTERAVQLQAATGERPAVLDKIDFDEVIDQLADMYAVPAGVVLGDDVVAERRAAREEAEAAAAQQAQMAQEAQAMAQAAPQVSGAMRDLAETPGPEGGSLLESMAGMMGGAQPDLSGMAGGGMMGGELSEIGGEAP